MPDLLFVYGTLRSEFDNQYANLLRSQAILVGKAVMPGSIYRVNHYPAFRPEPVGEVHGELYRLMEPDVTFNTLDEYEGSEFERVVVKGAWIYQYKDSPAESSRILSGDFLAP
jgi:gamma-glutamylcyclotransferase (GGCT)/AIG2-like uncharacterized protein YtfP